MPLQIRDIIYCFSKDLRTMFGNQLSKVILYGSYARGDYNEKSDIDVMILVSIPSEKIGDYMNQVSDLSFDYFMKYGIDISPVVKNEEHYNYWVDTLPFYKNINTEGVVLNG